MSKSYIGFLLVAALALLITRIAPDKMWIAAIVIVDDLVDSRRTVTLLRSIEHRQVMLDRHQVVPECQVSRLILFVVGVREIDR